MAKVRTRRIINPSGPAGIVAAEGPVVDKGHRVVSAGIGPAGELAAPRRTEKKS